MKNKSKKGFEFAGQGLRFVVLGGLNTIFTGILLSLISLVINEYLSYLLVYAIGLFIAFWVGGKWVYNSSIHAKAAYIFFSGYLFVFIIGLFFLWVLSSYGFGGPYSGLVVLVTAPLNFLVGRYAFRKRGRGHV